MKRLLILCCLVLAGCGESEIEQLSKAKISDEIKANGTITVEQAEYIAANHNNGTFAFSGLTSIGWNEVQHIVKFESISLTEVTSITDYVALRLSEARILDLGLTSISDKQARQLGHLNKSDKWRRGSTELSLKGLTSVTALQCGLLSNVDYLYLMGLTSLTEEQAERLSRGKVSVPDEFKPLIDKYKNQ